jgi:formate dehydrogenase maturation protein FdhE
MAPHVITLAIATLVVGWLMTVAGLQKSALELKKRRRICPSCGRAIEARVCSTCT